MVSQITGSLAAIAAPRHADWLQTLRHIPKQCRSAHFKDENFGSISSTMTAGDWEQLCAEWGGPALIIVDLPRTHTLMATSWQFM